MQKSIFILFILTVMVCCLAKRQNVELMDHPSQEMDDPNYARKKQILKSIRVTPLDFDSYDESKLSLAAGAFYEIIAKWLKKKPCWRDSPSIKKCDDE